MSERGRSAADERKRLLPAVAFSRPAKYRELEWYGLHRGQRPVPVWFHATAEAAV